MQNGCVLTGGAGRWCHVSGCSARGQRGVCGAKPWPGDQHPVLPLQHKVWAHQMQTAVLSSELAVVPVLSGSARCGATEAPAEMGKA